MLLLVPSYDLLTHASMVVMSRLSFGALLKAKRALAQQPDEDASSGTSTSDNESGSEDVEAEAAHTGHGPHPDERKELKPKEKRANKHAYVIYSIS